MVLMGCSTRYKSCVFYCYFTKQEIQIGFELNCLRIVCGGILVLGSLSIANLLLVLVLIVPAAGICNSVKSKH